MAEGFIPTHGGYKSLQSYKKAVIIYDATVFFCRRFCPHDYRTTDQMVQASRSGKQNIVEASMASATSKETEIKLANVARASLEELLEDYRDFLRVNNLPLWKKGDKRAMLVRNLGYRADASYLTYKSYIENDSPEITANAIICLIHQSNYMLDQLIRKLEHDFLEQGGLRERMAQARYQVLNRTPPRPGP